MAVRRVSDGPDGRTSIIDVMGKRGDDPFTTRVKRVSAIAIVVFLGVAALLQGRNTQPSVSGQPATPTPVAQKPSPAQQPVAQLQPTTAPAASPAVTAQVPSASPVVPASSPTVASATVGTRQNPIPFGQEHAYTRDGRTFRVRVLEVAQNARGQFPEAGPINPKPPDGQDYIVTKIRLTYVDGPQDKPTSGVWSR